MNWCVGNKTPQYGSVALTTSCFVLLILTAQVFSVCVSKLLPIAALVNELESLHCLYLSFMQDESIQLPEGIIHSIFSWPSPLSSF